MKPTDIFSPKDSECLFCRDISSIIVSSINYFDSPIYQCKNCEEQMSLVTEDLLFFTLFDLDVYLNFLSNKIHISNRNKVHAKANWINFYNFNKLKFNNRYKLHKKLKSYLVFS